MIYTFDSWDSSVNDNNILSSEEIEAIKLIKNKGSENIFSSI